MPTKWFFTGLVVVFLAGSAAFGGLNDVPAPPVPEIDAGESFTGAELRIQPERASLIDGFPEQGILPEEGKRLLVVVAEVENVWDEPVSTLDKIGAGDNIRPRGVTGLDAESAPLTVAVLSDGTERPELQPRVPVELAFIWEVDPDAVQGDTLTVDLYDKSYRAEGFVTYGERFENPFVAASSDLPLKDVGEGTAPADGSDG